MCRELEGRRAPAAGVLGGERRAGLGAGAARGRKVVVDERGRLAAEARQPRGLPPPARAPKV
jgi:hypothetical protein